MKKLYLIISIIVIIILIASIKSLIIINKIREPIKKLESAFNKTKSAHILLYDSTSEYNNNNFILTNSVTIKNLKDIIVNYDDKIIYTVFTDVKYTISTSFLVILYNENEKLISFYICGGIIIINDCVSVETDRDIDGEIMRALNLFETGRNVDEEIIKTLKLIE